MKRNKKKPVNENLVIGKRSIQELLKHHPERIEHVDLLDREKSSPVFNRLKELRIPFSLKDRDQLTKKAGTDSHQGYVARVKKREPLPFNQLLADLEEKEQALVLILDSITDPHNVGAILRAAECFGADAVVWSKNRGAPITPVVTKTSVGASELLEISLVSNLAEAVKKLQKAGIWVVTTELDEEAACLWEASLPKKCAVVLGSEGKGVQPLVSKLSDQKVYIPMKGCIGSLNVSQAAAVVLSYVANCNCSE